MSNRENTSAAPNVKENSFAYQRRMNPMKEQILSLCEKNMDNTLWVVRKWFRDEMELVNSPDNKR